jgi:ribosomal protein S27AE
MDPPTAAVNVDSVELGPALDPPPNAHQDSHYPEDVRNPAVAAAAAAAAAASAGAGTAGADEENQLLVQGGDTDLSKKGSGTRKPFGASSPVAKVQRSTSLDSGIVPSPPTPMKRFESDPVTTAEKLEAEEHHLAPQAFNGSDRGSLSNGLRRIWKLPRLRSLSLLTTPKLNPDTFFCTVCLENCSVSLGFVIANCSEQHKYCRDCLHGYYTAQIADGAIEHFCPGVGDGCHGLLCTEELQSLVSDEAFQRHNRLIQVKKNPLYRECPSCNTGVTLADQSPKVVCGSCGTEYCFFHSNAHAGMTCEQYARTQSRRTRQDMSASNEFVSRTTKCCPFCNSPTEKNGGCNHM